MPVHTTAVHIPLTAGMKENIDPKLLPDGVLLASVNTRIRKDGRIGVRNGYSAVAMGTPTGGTLVPYDLLEFNGRLLCLGDQLSANNGYPTNVYELMSTASGSWAPSTPGSLGTHLLNPIGSLRELSTAPQSSGGLTGVIAVGACNGYVMAAYKSSGFNVTFVNVYVESTGQCILSTSMSFTEGDPHICTPVVTGSQRCFILVGRSVDGQDVVAYRFNPALDANLVTLGIIDNGAAAITALAANEVVGASQFVIAVDRTGAVNLNVSRFNTTGAQQGSTITIAATTPEAIDVEANSAGSGSISLAHLKTNTVTLYSWTFAGALTGPTSVTTAAIANFPVFVTRLPANAGLGFAESIAVSFNTAPGAPNRPVDFLSSIRTLSTHAQSTTVGTLDLRVVGRPLSAVSNGVSVALLVPADVGDLPDITVSRTSALVYLSATALHMATLDTLLGTGGQQDVARDASTGKVLWARRGVDLAAQQVLRVCSLSFQSAERRQVAQQASHLFFAGANPQVWDGSMTSECGFAEIPGIRSATTGNGAGALTASAQYDYVATWSYVDGAREILLSAPSEPFSVTTGVGEDTVSVNVSTPHMMKVGASGTLLGSGIIITLWRTYWDGSTKTIGYRKAASSNVALAIVDMAPVVLIVDLKSDVDLLDEELLYTDAGQGALSGTLPRVAPSPCSYIWPTATGLILAGLPNAAQFQESQPIQPENSLTFAPNALTGVSFFGLCGTSIKAVAVVFGARVLFSREGIFVSAGQGPDADGRGDMPVPVVLPTDYGLIDGGWRSLLLTKDGLWFQADNEKLCVMPGQGSPIWGGMPVRSTLALYPTIVGAALAGDDSIAVFAANDVDSGVLIVRDQRNGEWSYDEVPGSGLIRGVTAVDGRVFVIVGSTVYQQTSLYADNASTAIPMRLEFGSATPFGLTGDGELSRFTLLGEFRGDCVVTMSISFDDGKTFTAMNAHTLTAGASLAIGDAVELEFVPRRRKCSRFRLKLVVTSAAASELIAISGLTLHLINKNAPSKLPSSRRK